MGRLGVVYTKDWVVDLVLDLVGYRSDLDLVGECVIEPACGEGAFVRGIVRRLCERASCTGRFNKEDLKDCIRAYDLDRNAVKKCRAFVRSYLVERGMSSDDARWLSNHWVLKKDFITAQNVRARWVVGNPPYVRARDIARETREQYSSLLSTTSMGTDLYIAFFEKGLRLLKEGGGLCYICSDRWLQNKYGTRLRELVSSEFNFDLHIRMHGVDAFEDRVSAYPAISRISRSAAPNAALRYVECSQGFGPEDANELMRQLDSTGHVGGPCFTFTRLPKMSGSSPMPLASSHTVASLIDIAMNNPKIEDAGITIGIGIASGCDGVYITDNPNLVEQDRLLPLFYMRDWRAGNKDKRRWLVNPWLEDGTLVDLDDYPRLRTYYETHSDRLKCRRVAKDHPDQWYRTLDKPNYSLLGREMLLFPDLSGSSSPVLSDGSKYPHHNCYWIISDVWDIKALGGLLMSHLIESYISAFGVKMRGQTLRFQAQYLRLIHIPEYSKVNKEIIRMLQIAFDRGDKMLADQATIQAYGLESEDAR